MKSWEQGAWSREISEMCRPIALTPRSSLPAPCPAPTLPILRDFSQGRNNPHDRPAGNGQDVRPWGRAGDREFVKTPSGFSRARSMERGVWSPAARSGRVLSGAGLPAPCSPPTKEVTPMQH